MCWQRHAAWQRKGVNCGGGEQGVGHCALGSQCKTIETEIVESELESSG